MASSFISIDDEPLYYVVISNKMRPSKNEKLMFLHTGCCHNIHSKIHFLTRQSIPGLIKYVKEHQDFPESLFGDWKPKRFFIYQFDPIGESVSTISLRELKALNKKRRKEYLAKKEAAV